MRKRESPVVLVILGLIAVAALVWAGVLTHQAYDERAQAGRYLAAPRCAGSARPVGDCSAWLTQTVSDVSSGKSGLNINLDGRALHLWYLSAPGWIERLTPGDSVSVLVWHGSAQALRDPDGHVLYSEDSALYQGYSDIGGAVFMSGATLLVIVGMFTVSRRFQWRGRYVGLAVVLADAGASGAVSGAVIQRANSVHTGVQVGVILYCVIGIAAPVVMRLRGARKTAAHSGRPATGG